MISIIIPSFNRADIISETLESVISQTYTDWEIIIVDDGSTDSTKALIKEFIQNDKRIKFFTRPNEVQKGANSCRNFGFQKARGKYIKFLDSDDLLQHDCIGKQVAILESNNILQVCLSYGRFFNDQTKELEEFWSRNKEYNDYLLGHITNNIRWAVSDPLWRKSFFSIPPFKEGLMNSQEWLLHGQALLKLKNIEIYNLIQTFTLIRRGNLRMSSDQSATYYKNQKLARIYLLYALFKNRKIQASYIYELLKQVIVYYYWQMKRTI